MKHLRPLAKSAALLASALAVTLFLAGCDTSKPAPPAATATGEKVFIQFEGPWAFEADPKDANVVIAIAPKAKGHRDLFVKASNQSLLGSGTYELAVPPRTGPADGTVETGIFRAKPDPANLQRALDAKGERYAIRLPKPEVYKIASRFRSRVDKTYPPDPSTENDYATEISLLYTVSTLTGFSLSGTADSGNYNPMLLRVETPLVRFVIEPTEYDDPHDQCSLHSRESFRDLVKLLSLTFYVDFPDDPVGCHDTDPQNPKAAAKHKSARLSPSPASGIDAVEHSQRASAFPGASPLLASVSGLGRSLQREMASLMYFFGKPIGDCKAPIIVGP